ncbi:M23 family metallopeptidase [Cohnella soli]|uniref:M23 family metallopeptidase n=1 Tax=Cohnella soli TaxID=425005 RepID=A0ABW0HR26_9BACL
MRLFWRRGKGFTLRTACTASAFAAVLLTVCRSGTAGAAIGASSASGPATVSVAASSRSQDAPSDEMMFAKRKRLYDEISAKTGLDWQMVAAIDQYERTISRAHPKTRPKKDDAVTGVFVQESVWSGNLNPEPDDDNPSSIRFFSGIGRDGSGDGRADREQDEDALYSVAVQALQQGISDDDFSIGLWEYYHNTRAVQRILQFARLYRHFDRLDLKGGAFPLPVGDSYSFRSTWGSGRSWGGYRIHEGTDIFAGHGTTVRSTCYGIVEIKGWNAFGGWRIGIRDLNNLYHYYAHLSGYEKNLKVGDIVKPGQTIGWVGSSGYGRPGTQGKFPPHLHYGVYRDRGLVEWAFDPYPMLKRWEQDEFKMRRSKKTE